MMLRVADNGSELLRDVDPNDAATATLAVARWVINHVEGFAPPLRFVRVAGGHSCITFVVHDAAGRRIVLRRPPLGHVLASAHDVLREHRIMGALHHTAVPVPTMIGACDDREVLDAPFFLMAHVDGIVLHDAEMVRSHFPDSVQRVRAGESLIDAMVALHSVDPDEVGLGDLSRRSGYLDRQLKRWHGQWTASKTRELPDMERLHGWLVANRPVELATRIVHGDCRLGNAIHGPDGTVLALLDWELCSLGDPRADLSYLLRAWVSPDEPLLTSVEQPTRAGEFSSRDGLVARYETATGTKLTDLDYWMAFNAWRSASIGEGVYRRYIDGNMGTRSDDVEVYARSVEVGAAAGLRSAGLTDG